MRCAEVSQSAVTVAVGLCDRVCAACHAANADAEPCISSCSAEVTEEVQERPRLCVPFACCGWTTRQEQAFRTRAFQITPALALLFIHSFIRVHLCACLKRAQHMLNNWVLTTQVLAKPFVNTQTSGGLTLQVSSGMQDFVASTLSASNRVLLQCCLAAELDSKHHLLDLRVGHDHGYNAANHGPRP